MNRLLGTCFWYVFLFPFVRTLGPETSWACLPLGILYLTLSGRSFKLPFKLAFFLAASLAVSFTAYLFFTAQLPVSVIAYIAYPLCACYVAVFVFLRRPSSILAFMSSIKYVVPLVVIIYFLRLPLPFIARGSLDSGRFSFLASEPSTATYGIISMLLFSIIFDKYARSRLEVRLWNLGLLLLSVVWIVYGRPGTLVITLILGLSIATTIISVSSLASICTRLSISSTRLLIASLIVVLVVAPSPAYLPFVIQKLGIASLDVSSALTSLPSLVYSVVDGSLLTSDFRIRQLYLVFSEPFALHSPAADSIRILSQFRSFSAFTVVPPVPAAPLGTVLFLMSWPLGILIISCLYVLPCLYLFHGPLFFKASPIIRLLMLSLGISLSFFNSTPLLPIGPFWIVLSLLGLRSNESRPCVALRG